MCLLPAMKWFNNQKIFLMKLQTKNFEATANAIFLISFFMNNVA